MPEINVPCLPGDTVYILLKHISGVYDIFETEVASVNFYAYHDESVARIDVKLPYPELSRNNTISYQLEDIGKKLFLSLEDAENAMNAPQVFPKRRKERERSCPKK